MSEGWTPRLQAKAYEQVIDAAARARVAGRTLAVLDVAARDKALHVLADALDSRADEVLAANSADLEAATTLDDGALERLRVTERMLVARADELRRLAEQADPLGEQTPAEPHGYELGQGGAGHRDPGRPGPPVGTALARMRVPLGVIGLVYEARPVTALEILGPALRAGNSVLLRGALAAVHTDEALAAVIRDALDDAGLPADTVALLPTRERSSIRYLVGAAGLVDLVVVRGGPRLVASALADAKVPALRLSSGNCHVYVDAGADQALAVDVVLRSKAEPSAPHAVEAVLVHADLAPTFVPLLVDAAARSGVRVHGDERVCRLVPGVPEAATESRANGYRSADITVAVVDSLDGALETIERHGQGHTEVIVTGDDSAARAFFAGVDAALVAVNVPTTVGEATVFATQKLHVRGSVTATDLTTVRWTAWNTSTPEG
jgi:glutamate-5-semialdehyde dehydrogenase